jgi:lipopolysaccharide export system permease protein
MKRLRTLDLYMLQLSLGTLAAVIAIVMSLMVLEHLPRLIDITRLSGHNGYIVGQTILGLLPEYAGIGAIFGLFLAIALTVRKLALRGELHAIEAMGVSPLRWLRMPLALTAVASLFVLLNQGWLMPAGERKVDDIGRRMAAGDFGYNLSANEFHAIGDDTVLRFEGIDRETGSLTGLFVKTDSGTFQAASGRLALAHDREGYLYLKDGQLIQPSNRVMNFSAISLRLARLSRDEAAPVVQPDDFRTVAMSALIGSGDTSRLRAASARLLWVELALLVPLLAMTLGRPPIRSTSALGIFVGMCGLVLLIKSIDWYSGLTGTHPVVEALALGAGWIVVVVFATTPARREQLAAAGQASQRYASQVRDWWQSWMLSGGSIRTLAAPPR